MSRLSVRKWKEIKDSWSLVSSYTAGPILRLLPDFSTSYYWKLKTFLIDMYSKSLRMRKSLNGVDHT